MVELLRDLQVTSSSKVLDIGRSQLTTIIRQEFDARVDTLGFGPDEAAAWGQHYEFDLNRAQDLQQWRSDMPRYDVVLMAEVIEHLHTAPELVMSFVGELVTNNGILLLQTPNAASLPKRVKLLMGRNPYDRIRSDTSDPGHFREYTVAELVEIASTSGFTVERCQTRFYFDARYGRHVPGQVQYRPIVGAMKNWLYSMFPPSMREGITLVLRKSTRDSRPWGGLPPMCGGSAAQLPGPASH